ncbi:hypothetical protein HYPSUDRAFT_210040 [Hypholoma sublateritium FD-334 SS-4]|uniref:Uncharacterized protein n=1 Tax=Hypholoma sublateritium (strain FD-334 SS-4) TaxID=945553 RepID=A0A0D2LPY6_HYPSF|nr:hypothetical protein HYPSUDRAFT_210040 [Hypholoma sublateritium FD-334 SS-4]
MVASPRLHARSHLRFEAVHAVDTDLPISPAHDDAASLFAVFVDRSGASHHPPPPSILIVAIPTPNAVCVPATSMDVVPVPDLDSAPCSCAGPAGRAPINELAPA